MDFKLGVFVIISAQFYIALAASPCACTKEYRPVCGTDGKTYSNRCQMKCKAYESGKEITVDYQGTCEEREPKYCACTYDYNPVCGSDGITYPNKCSLNCEKKSNPGLKIDHEGACNTERETCICPFNYSPVCGSDGKTYGNLCTLNCASKKNPKLRFVKNGECE